MHSLRKGPSGPPVFTGAYQPGGTVRADDDGDLESVVGSAPGQLWYWNGSLWLPTGAGPSDSDVPVWNSDTNDYEYREYVSAGELAYFDLVDSTIGLWNFDNTLADFSGNGFTLTPTGALGFSYVYPGKVGVMLGGSNTLEYAPTGSVLGVTGDMTVELIMQATDDAVGSIIQYAAVGETQAANALWGLGFNGGSSASVNRRLTWTSEHGAGIDDTFTSGGNTNLGYIHNVQYIAASRIGNVVRFYYNGLQMGPPSAVLTTPDGGSTSRLVFGAATPSAPIPSVIFSARIQNVGRDGDFIRNSYNRTMGPAYGRLAA